jgi:hypothetical protein
MPIRPFVFALFLLCPQTVPGQSRPDFSGTWKMDFTRSESAHQDVPIGPVTLLIHQTDAEISIETRRAEAGSKSVTSEKLSFPLDGVESARASASGQPIKVRAHWDGAKLVAETERDINQSTVTTMHVLLLSPNGKELTIEKTLNVQHGYMSPGSPKTTGSGKDVFLKVAK